MAQLEFYVKYRLRYAFVYGTFKTEEIVIEQAHSSWKNSVMLRFLFHGRKISVKDWYFQITLDEIDEEFLRLCKRIPASCIAFWKSIHSKLDGQVTKETRKTITKELKIFAISKAFIS